MRRSIRLRLLVAAGLGLGSLLLFAGLLLDWQSQRALMAELDRSLLMTAQAIGTLVEVEDGRIETESFRNSANHLTHNGQPLYFEIWSTTGQRIARSEALGESSLDLAPSQSAHPVYADVQLPQRILGRSVRLRMSPVIDNDEAKEIANSSPASIHREFALILALDSREMTLTMKRIRRSIAIIILGALALSLFLMNSIVEIGLRPLRNTSDRIARIDLDSLGEPLSEQEAPSEVRPVITRVNDLLARLNQAFLREQEFSANVAHELRTPLAGIRAQLEWANARPREGADYRYMIATCLLICEQTEALVENLTMLSRLETGQLIIRREPVNIGSFMRSVWTSFAATAESHGFLIEWNIDDELLCTSDPTMLRIVLCNLFDNSVTYTNSNGSVRLSAEGHGDSAVLEVRNSGSSINSLDARKVVDRFWQHDSARSTHGRHAGLGLTLCREIASALAAEIRIDSTEGGDFVVVLQLPHRIRHVSGVDLAVNHS